MFYLALSQHYDLSCWEINSKQRIQVLSDCEIIVEVRHFLR